MKSSTVQIEAGSRWDAVALLNAFTDVHGFMVQANGHFVVHLYSDGGPVEQTCDFRGRVEAWLAKRSLDSTQVHLPDGTVVEVGAPGVREESLASLPS